MAFDELGVETGFELAGAACVVPAVYDLGRLTTYSLFDGLNPLEVWHVDLASQGLTCIQAARVQLCPPNTVGTIRERIIQKVKAVNTPHVIGMACSVGLFTEQLETLTNSRPLERVERLELHLAGQGFTVAGAAEERGVGVSTTRHNRARIRQLYNAKNLAHAIRIAHERGDLPLET